MRVTVATFREVREKAIEVGIDKVQHVSRGEVLSFTSKVGQVFAFDPENLEDFMRAGLLRFVR